MGNLVAIVGRPNVGKSTLFNRLTKSRQAIVSDEAGTTRDRQYGKCEWCGHEFSVVDTGGWVVNSDDIFEEEIRKQVIIATEEADLVLFLCDINSGVTGWDMDVAQILRRAKLPVILVANKADDGKDLYDQYEFYKLGLGDPWPISAATGSGTGDLLDKVIETLPEKAKDDLEEGIPRFAVVGRPNAGKSSIINAFIGEDRNIVTEIAGTTRDSIYTRYDKFGFDFYLVDTAGIRRKNKVTEDLEFYSVMRSIRAIENSDVCILMIDATRGIEAQDMNIFQLIQKNNKSLVVVVNKWDLVEDKSQASIDTFINAFIGEDRNIVTEIAGTTRDSIYTRYDKFGFDFYLVDTAGIRRKNKVTEDLEFYSVMRSIRSIESSDVCILMIDATRGIEAQDMNIFQLIQKNQKSLVVVVNKWDIAEDKSQIAIKTFENAIRERMAPFVDFPIIFASALTKQRIFKVLETAKQVYLNRTAKIGTTKLNEVMLPLIEAYPPPSIKGKYIKIKYCSQVPNTQIPTFVFYANLPQYVKEPYKRFLENKIRENWQLSGCPINVFVRQK